MTQTLTPVRLATFSRTGRPRTKGSLNVFCCKDKRHTIRVEEETKDSKLWRRQMAKSAQVAMLLDAGSLLRWAGPVRVRATFIFAPTVGVDGQVWPSHRTPFPTDIKLGDVDKLARNLNDALTDAGVLADDSYVVTLEVHKRWTALGEAPGMEGEVWTVPHE
jgi:Holliday junction resolvase RusA-like endonuclease